MKKLPPLLVIVGPTASGKSALAVRLARRFNGELVSADSRQVYIGLDIGTAKLKPPRGIKQWLVDIVRPDQLFTLADYQRHAFAAIRNIHRRGKLPILVGGTGLYIDAVTRNWQIPRVAPNRKLRAILEKELKAKSLPYLVHKLKKIDPESARAIDIKNPRRVIRALEVAMTTGQSFRLMQMQGPPKYRVLKLGLFVPRLVLRAKIQRRAASMVRRGLVKETGKLLKKYPATLPAMTGIEYRVIGQHLAGEIDKCEAVQRLALRSCQYARRQMTWWKRQQDIYWINDIGHAKTIVSRWIRNTAA